MSVSAEIGTASSVVGGERFSEFISLQQPALEKALSGQGHDPEDESSNGGPPTPSVSLAGQSFRSNGSSFPANPLSSSSQKRSNVGFNVLQDPPSADSPRTGLVPFQQSQKFTISKPPDADEGMHSESEATQQPTGKRVQRHDSMASSGSWNSTDATSVEGRAFLDKSLFELSAANKNRLFHLNDFFNRIRIGGDETSPHLQRIFSTPASDLASSYHLSHFELSMPVADALQALLKDKSILVHGHRPGPQGLVATEMVWTREHLFERSLQIDDLSSPLFSIVNDVPAVPTLAAHDTLDAVIECLSLYGANQVATVDEDGGVTGVIYFDDIFERVVQDVKNEWQASGGGDISATKREFRHISSVVWSDDQDGFEEPRQPKTMRETLAMRRSVGRAQKSAQAWVETVWTELLIFYLLALDCSGTIFEATQSDPKPGIENPLNIVTGVILSVYVFEACVRVYGYRWSLLNGTRLLDSIDLLVVIASVIVYCIIITETTTARFATAVTAARILRFLRLVKIVKRIRRVLYANRWRYQKNGFDLNLTYVTPTCIAMSLPANGTEANFFNPIDDVARFFTTIHDKHFLIFDLCAERDYDITLFNGRVEKIDVEDLNPPKLHQLISILARISSFCDEDPSNVVAVHSRVGRSRTGVVVSSWLVYSGFSDTASDALTYFSKRRAGDKALPNNVVQGPSQRRYVQYVEEVMRAGGYRANRMILLGVSIITCPKTGSDGSWCPWFIVEQDERVVYDSSDHKQPTRMARNDARKDYDGMRVGLLGDVRVIFYDGAGGNENASRDMLCFMWFHTGFMKQKKKVFRKDEIDMACHDVACKMFSDNFAIEFHFEGNDQPQSPRLGADDVSSPRGDASTQFTLQRTSSSPVLLGLWRKVDPPSKNILDRNKRFRGREQELVAEGREIKIKLQDGARRGSVDMSDEMLTPLADNLCSASGPVVVHTSVRMFSVAGQGEVHGNKQAKKLMEYYKKGGGETGGALVKKARALVSGQKRRFQEDGFDLDLTYVTPRLIAMGYPSKGVEGSYRNSESEVYRFFQERHAGHFRIINLCSERAYDLDIFHGSVARYPFPDHNPPAMELILPACAHIHTFLQANENYVCAVHCKAGKGRTGLILISYLLYGGLRRTALSARAFYDSQRTYDKKGLTIISQIRYTHYFEEQLRRLKAGEPCSVSETKSPAMRLRRLRLNTVPHMDRDRGCDPVVTVLVKCEQDFEEYELFRSKNHHEARHFKPTDKICDLEIGADGEGLRVAGDVHIILGHDSQSFMSKPSKMCFFWVHTTFMHHPPPEMAGKARELTAEECMAEGLPARTWCLSLHKSEIDQAAQDSKDAKFDPDFSIDLYFNDIPGDLGTGETLDQLRRGRKKQSSRIKLFEEKSDYQRYLASCEAGGRVADSFETWLMNNSQQQQRQRLLSFGGSKTSLATTALTGLESRTASSLRPSTAAFSEVNSIRSAGSSQPGEGSQVERRSGPVTPHRNPGKQQVADVQPVSPLEPPLEI